MRRTQNPTPVPSDFSGNDLTQPFESWAYPAYSWESELVAHQKSVEAAVETTLNAIPDSSERTNASSWLTVLSAQAADDSNWDSTSESERKEALYATSVWTQLAVAAANAAAAAAAAAAAEAARLKAEAEAAEAAAAAAEAAAAADPENEEAAAAAEEARTAADDAAYEATEWDDVIADQEVDDSDTPAKKGEKQSIMPWLVGGAVLMGLFGIAAYVLTKDTE